MYGRYDPVEFILSPYLWCTSQQDIQYNTHPVAGDQFDLDRGPEKGQTNLSVPPLYKLVPLDRVRVEFADGFVSGVRQERTEDVVADEVGDGPAGEGAEPTFFYRRFH